MLEHLVDQPKPLKYPNIPHGTRESDLEGVVTQLYPVPTGYLTTGRCRQWGLGANGATDAHKALTKGIRT